MRRSKQVLPNDTIIDNSPDNIIRTSAGDDSIYIGNGGNDYIDGGTGDDRVYIDEEFSSLNISRTGSLYYVEDNDRTFSATLDNIEEIVDITGAVYQLA